MAGMISQLLSALGKGLKMLLEFLAVVGLGLLVAIVFALPWLIRAASILAWIGGTYMAGQTIDKIYGAYSDPLPLMALWMIPAILAATLPTWLYFTKQLSHLWGAFFLFGLFCLGFSLGAPWLLKHWSEADLFFRTAPVLLLAGFVFFISIRLKFIQFGRNHKKGDSNA